MITQNMLRTFKGRRSFEEKKNPICDCSRTDQMSVTDQITEIAAEVVP